MILITKENILEELIKGSIKFSLIYPIEKGKHFRLNNSIRVFLDPEHSVKIPKGFEFDGSSVPRFLWWIFPSYGNFFFAALLHDYLYQTQYMHKDLGYQIAQELADIEMLEWSNIINNKNIFKKIDNYLRFLAVRLFGKKVYINL